VLPLSLMGLVLGVWLRQSEGRGSPHPGPTLGSLFLTKPYKCWVENHVDQLNQCHVYFAWAAKHKKPPGNPVSYKNKNLPTIIANFKYRWAPD
ncbi:hypothetical protein, partial [Enterobacter hormaechei]